MIRIGYNDDIESVLGIVILLPEYFIPETLALIKKDFVNHKVAVCEENNEILGFVIWQSNSLEIEILWIATHPRFWRRGVATDLIKFVTASATTQLNLLLKTATDDSILPTPSFIGNKYIKSLRFFENQGFKECCRINSYWAPDNNCLLLMRRLKI